MFSDRGVPFHCVGHVVEIAVAECRCSDFSVDRIGLDWIPAEHPHSGRASGERRLVDPTLHLAGGAEHVADEGHPIRMSHQARAALGRITLLGGIVDPSARLILERAADAAQMIAEERQIDAVAMGIVALGVLAVVALEQYVMRADHMTGIEPGLDPVSLGVDVAHVHVVVADDRTRPRRARHHEFVGPHHDAVFDQHLGRCPREADAIAAAAGLGPGGVVNVKVPQLDTERVSDADAFSVPLGTVDVARPGLRRPLEAEIAAVAADQFQVFDAGIGDMRSAIAGQLGGVTGPIGDMHRGGECDG